MDYKTKQNIFFLKKQLCGLKRYIICFFGIVLSLVYTIFIQWGGEGNIFVGNLCFIFFVSMTMIFLIVEKPLDLDEQRKRIAVFISILMVVGGGFLFQWGLFCVFKPPFIFGAVFVGVLSMVLGALFVSIFLYMTYFCWGEWMDQIT